jgi:hypothetical protein
MKKKSTQSKFTTAKRRKPVAKPNRRPKKKDDFIGRLNGVIKIVGDIESPIVPPEAWEYD